MTQGRFSEANLAELVSLADLVSRTVKEIAEEYAAARDPGFSSPSDPQPSEDDIPPRVAKAFRVLDAACADMSGRVGNPGQLVMKKFQALQEPASMLIAPDSKFAELLLHERSALPVDQLAQSPRVDAEKLRRLINFLATKHNFTEIRPNIFLDNRLNVKFSDADVLDDPFMDEWLH
ncbi:hypothetical protein B0H16DRAFT_1707972 [Mycena metata]|uniref:Uncharacterized protein n=1 Tax=Mycena metata TaxID=1033252 RepID=A0AAD7KH84_9AGAR|nr:hypothetical protein B0H16DRAFT_1707972 [Mycena metata]